MRWEDVDSDYLFGNAQSGKWHFLLLVLVFAQRASRENKHLTEELLNSVYR